MMSIKPLPEAARNSVRSGIILFDLTRVVEELVLNSLDAGATKVSVFVSMGTCYVKVVDDGSGISRDELALLGERYATSKVHGIGDVNTSNSIFGYRGEALASISDVSLLEIVTKAYGRPNGYRKVIKGSKCLYVGIDDDRRDVGTTVVVRDLFYNQPVRRKHMQSSPKKVLHSVNKCVLRIALVHTKVSFKVVDIESGDELLCTHPSSSPLPLLMSDIGIEDSGSLQELNVSDGVLKLTGYISGPCYCFPMKVFQYVYINSRFVCKGAIHKLLNRLATEFDYLDPWKANTECQKGKRSKALACPAYIVNLSCPQSLYDLTFEPSTTCVEFKDWVPVLTFIEKAIHYCWRKYISCGESFLQATDIFGKDERKQVDSIKRGEDFSGNPKFTMRKCGVRNHQSSLPSPPSENLIDGSNNLYRKPDDQLTKKEFLGWTDSAFKPLDGPHAKCLPNMLRRTHESYDHLWTSDSNLLSAEDNSLRNMFTATETSNDHVDSITCSTRRNEYLEVEPGVSDGSIGSDLSFDCHELTNYAEVSNSIQNAFLQCSSRQSLSLDRAMFASDEGFGFQIDDFNTKRKRAFPDDLAITPDDDIGSQRFDFFSRTRWQDDISFAQDFPRLRSVGDMSTDPDLFPSYGERFDEENNLSHYSFTSIRNSASSQYSFNSEWCPLASQATSWNVEYVTNKDALEKSYRPSKRANYGFLPDGERNDCRTGYDITKSSYHERSNAICTKAPSNFKDYPGFDDEFCKSLKIQNLISLEHSAMPLDKPGGLCVDSSGEDNSGINKCYRKRNLTYQVGARTPKDRSTRSHSAPPFPRQKRRYISLNNYMVTEAEKVPDRIFQDDLTSPGAGGGESKLFNQSSSVSIVHGKPSLTADVFPSLRPEMKIQDISLDMNINSKDVKLDDSKCLRVNDTAPLQDFVSRDIQDSVNSDSKWRNSFVQSANNNKSHGVHFPNTILDISSGFLHLAGDSLIPESISKSYLRESKVLQQVDKKFIPVVSGGILAIIDQHAADERIRLEELRQKVLSGEARTATYLDAEKELVLPEIGYQLLENYSEQIKDWGWICNVHAQDSTSFKKNMDLMHRQPTVVTLFAVPCILGVNLSEVDLLEFLQQLADTDGSSTIPSSVLRVLNYKACRGAIMFGDSLLPSQCSLIVEELKQTSLCFQCAHGRPTTVPIVNLKALRKQIPKLGLSNDCSHGESWHGLRSHKISLERTAQRLKSATA